MSPRASASSSDEPVADTSAADTPAEETPADDDMPTEQKNMNEVMAAQNEAAAAEPPPSTDPPGSDVVNEENVRRYPHLFTDEQKATVSGDELPETDTEKAQREAAEKAEEAATAES